MTPETRLRTALDERLDDLPSVPAEHYLAAGTAAVRRRRRTRAGLAAGVLAVGLVAAGVALPRVTDGGGGERAREERPQVATAPAQPAARSLSGLDVRDGLGDIDAFSTEEIPGWAQEYGNHGPAAIAPDGRLWIAPDATVVRSIDDPFGDVAASAGVTHAYAVEAEFADEGLVWSFVYQDTDGFVGGRLDEPGRWTSDLGVWAGDEVASVLGAPGFAEVLAQFASDTSEELVPGKGVEVVAQQRDVEVWQRPHYAKQTAAQVRVAGQTWFVLGSGKADGRSTFYEAYDVTAVGADDLAGFLRFLTEPQDDLGLGDS